MPQRHTFTLPCGEIDAKPVNKIELVLGRNICIGIGTEIGLDFRDRVREREGLKMGRMLQNAHPVPTLE